VKRVVWVVGSGLLGGAIRRVARVSHEWTVVEVPALPWSSPAEMRGAAAANVRSLRGRADTEDCGWSIVWAAGASTVASNDDQTALEAHQFRVILDAMREASVGDDRGSLFFPSSVGAVYAGSDSPPFTEETPVAATSPYGRLKLKLEEIVAEFSRETGTPSVIGRVTNLYGPGQRLDKSQGLISHLLLSRYGDLPATIFVPLETVRDYFYVDDCARLVLDSLLELERSGAKPGTVVTKIFGSGQGVSISSLLGYLRFITKAAPSVSIGRRPSAKFQAADLRIKSIVWPHLDRREKTPIAAGFHATMIDVLGTLQR
jgi:UDP-glucose 4-epimerase